MRAPLNRGSRRDWHYAASEPDGNDDCANGHQDPAGVLDFRDGASWRARRTLGTIRSSCAVATVAKSRQSLAALRC